MALQSRVLSGSFAWEVTNESRLLVGERETDRGPGKKAPEDIVGDADRMEFKNMYIIKIAL